MSKSTMSKISKSKHQDDIDQEEVGHSSLSEDVESDSDSEMEEESDPKLKQEMVSLVKQLRKTLKAHEATKILLTSKTSPVQKYLDRYAQALEITYSHEHHDYFLKIYNKYRFAILSNKSDKWIRTGSIKIRFGEDDRQTTRKGRKICIMLSSIYNVAHKLRLRAEGKLEGLPKEEYQKCADLNWCDTILLHLYRIFRQIAPDKDYDKLDVIIKGMEGELGVVKPSTNPLGNLGDLGKIVSGFMSGMSEASGIQKSKKGSATQQGSATQPSMPDVENIFGNLLQNDAIKNVINNMLTGLNGAGSIEEALQEVGSIMSDPKLKEIIIGTGIETATQAASMPKEESSSKISSPEEEEGEETPSSEE